MASTVPAQSIIDIAPIPQNVVAYLLPLSTACVEDVLHYPTPVVLSGKAVKVAGDMFSTVPSPLIGPKTAQLLLTTIPFPNAGGLANLTNSAIYAAKAGARSFFYTLAGSAKILLPLWAITYWSEAQKISKFKMKWTFAPSFCLVASLERFRTCHYSAISSTRSILGAIPWAIPKESKLLGPSGVDSLSRFFNWDPLDEDSFEQLMRILGDWLSVEGDQSTILLQSTSELSNLVQVYRTKRDSYRADPSFSTWRHRGNTLRRGSVKRLVFPVRVRVTHDWKSTVLPGHCVSANHWTAVVIDTDRHEVLFGDSFGLPMPAELVSIIT